jgi:hypothetical protein
MHLLLGSSIPAKFQRMLDRATPLKSNEFSK